MKNIPTRKGSWRKVATGVYVKNIGSYGTVKFGAAARVSFVPFPTCEIMDANGVHVAIPESADAKKYIAAAKKVYVKDTKAEAERVRKREAARARPDTKIPKWRPGSKLRPGQAEPSGIPPAPPIPFGNIAESIQFLKSEIRAFTHMAETDPANAAEYKKRISGLRARIKKLQA